MSRSFCGMIARSPAQHCESGAWRDISVAEWLRMHNDPKFLPIDTGVPDPVCELLLCGGWRTLAIDHSALKKGRVRRRSIEHVLFGDIVIAPQTKQVSDTAGLPDKVVAVSAVDDPEASSNSGDEAAIAVEGDRDLIAQGDIVIDFLCQRMDNDDDDDVDAILAWVYRVMDMLRPGRMQLAHHRAGMVGRHSYGSLSLLRCWIMSCVLKQSNQLREALQRAAYLILPAGVAAEFAQTLKSGDHAIPSAPTISRFRLRLDVSFMLHARRLHRASPGGASKHVRYLLADSSPQCHDWEMVEWSSIAVSVLPKLAAAADDLYLNLCGRLALDSDARAEHGKFIMQHIDHHIAVPTALGTRRTSLVHKLHALIHAVCMEAMEPCPDPFIGLDQ